MDASLVGGTANPTRWSRYTTTAGILRQLRTDRGCPGSHLNQPLTWIAPGSSFHQPLEKDPLGRLHGGGGAIARWLHV